MTGTNEAEQQVQTNRHLLPQIVKPKLYKLQLEPELEFPEQNGAQGKQDLKFQGKANIELEIISSTKCVTLHALDLEIKEAAVEVNNSKLIKAENISYDKEQQTATILFPETLLPTQKVAIQLDYTGTLNDQMVGFYRSSYKGSNGETRYMATTQFEPTDARRAFPCWDEPAIKAVFEITLIVPADRDCLSNMIAVSEHINESGKKVVQFQRTPIMSTYLLAFIVGEFDHIEDKTEQGIMVRVYTLKGSSELGRFALQVAVKTLTFFAEFFDIAYPLPKMDLVAIPDFAAGAMENWGCVTFRETALLIDPANSSTVARSRVAEVVAHELAHQWFGNLVTMEWWTHLWLNEGFATWAADLAVDHLFPSWGTWLQFVSSTFSAALRLDSLESSHPIEVEVKKAGDVNEIFDAISYCKGASVIRMLANYLSLESFQKGLQVYLKKFSYKNAATDDLWKVLEEVSGKPVFSMMSLWTRQTGYPVIQVKQNQDNQWLFEQTRFLSSGFTEQTTENATLWIIPIGAISSSKPTETRYFLLKGKKEEMNDVFGKEEDWFKLNSNQSGVYRVNYPLSLWEKLRKPVQECILSSTDRLGLSMDSFALCRAGMMPTTSALDMMASFENETDYNCWVDLISNFDSLHSVFGKTDESRYLMERFFCHILRNIAQQLGWNAAEGEEHSVSLLRPKVLRAMVDYKDANTLSIARQLFEQYIHNKDNVVADLRGVVMAAAVSSGGQKEFDQVKHLFETATLNEEKVRCLQTLGMTPQVSLMKEALEWGWQHVRYQDYIYLVSSIGSNPKGAELIWEYLKEHWNALYERYGKGNFMLTSFIRACTAQMTTQMEADQVEAFYRTKHVEGCERTIRQCVERIRVSAKWFERDEKATKEWLQRYVKDHNC
ncbi:Puromycin-sensitive aminopeptidase [Galdieria sulphuraria]|uniref:Aminopeptidase n=1 Tax=Galdieria sulphuraria TaxID=130081 RepID=M2W2V7_GALSU|nr:puromycin-sensitive aminopeptidase [Galdieria sulphuraria]EME30031.1 puromycin-sensitive aminopeptidase [Galdieria sulphuraria]GJD06245.1 Puromycin-sensitive aminopeptidase [Galdieria sulphuraria]|eukprot:XP_005706551.1 puromycin-sensitive aminopeptidase [Galdieria sulphuraria]